MGRQALLLAGGEVAAPVFPVDGDAAFDAAVGEVVDCPLIALLVALLDGVATSGSEMSGRFWAAENRGGTAAVLTAGALAAGALAEALAPPNGAVIVVGA